MFTNCFHCVNTDLFGLLSLKQIFSDFHTWVDPLNHGQYSDLGVIYRDLGVSNS